MKILNVLLAVFAIGYFTAPAYSQVIALNEGASHDSQRLGNETIQILFFEDDAHVTHYVFVSHLLNDKTREYDEVIGNPYGYTEAELKKLPKELNADALGKNLVWAIGGEYGAFGSLRFGQNAINQQTVLAQKVPALQQTIANSQKVLRSASVRNLPRTKSLLAYYTNLSAKSVRKVKGTYFGNKSFTVSGTSSGYLREFYAKEFKINSAKALKATEDLSKAESELLHSNAWSSKLAKISKFWRVGAYVGGAIAVTNLFAAVVRHFTPIAADNNMVLAFATLDPSGLHVALDNEAEVIKFKNHLEADLKILDEME